jgi:tetratricopeptide (TPR) repeat protein
LARAASYYAVFPNRPSDAAVLEEALLDDPADSHAQYFLGNFLFQYGRYEEAEKLWLQAASAGFQYSVLFRNLGVDAWKVKGNLGDAAGYYEKAIQLDRQDYRLYVDLDEIYAQQGSTRSRQALFANSPASVLEHDAARMRDCVLLINVGQPDKALGLLNGHRFKPWEQGQDVREIFVEANIQAGRLALEAKRFNEAEADFKNAMEYPPNLGIGKPDKPEDAAAHYWLGETFYQQGDKTGADREWRKLVNEPGEKRLSKFYEALAMEALGDADQAAQRLTALVQGAAGTQSGANNYYVAGLAERHLRREPQAIADFRKAVEINPTFWQAENEFNH